MSQTKDTDLLTLLGIESLPIQEQAEIIEQTVSLIEERVSERIFGSLPEEHHQTLTELFGGEDQESTRSFLSGHNINLEQVLTEEVERTKKELVQVAEAQS